MATEVKATEKLTAEEKQAITNESTTAKDLIDGKYKLLLIKRFVGTTNERSWGVYNYKSDSEVHPNITLFASKKLIDTKADKPLQKLIIEVNKGSYKVVAA